MNIWDNMMWPFLIVLIGVGSILDYKSRRKSYETQMKSWNDLHRKYEESWREACVQSEKSLQNQERIIHLLEEIKTKMTS